MTSPAPPKRRRALVIAEAANPEWVSVPLVGWSLASALRRVADVHIVTQVRNRGAFLRAGLEEGEDFTAIDTEAIARPVYKIADALRGGDGKGWTTLSAINSLSYPYFEHKVWQRFGPEILAGAFDVVHRITPLSPTIQGPIASKCVQAGAPFVVGPINGGVAWPEAFDAERRAEREWLSYVRGLYKMAPGRRAMLRAASGVIVGSRHTQSEIPEAFQDKVVYMPENGVDPARFSMRVESYDKRPLRACFIGRLVPYKGPDMLIEAAAPLVQEGRLILDIIGDGPMLGQLKAQAAAEGLGDGVVFHGWLDHQDVQKTAANAPIFAFPSIREFGGGAVLEAMALGLVPLVVDYAGPGELVDDVVGYKVPIGARADIVAGFRSRLSAIANDPAQLPALGAAARRRVTEKFTWARKAGAIAEIYEWVCGARTKPAFYDGLASSGRPAQSARVAA